MKINIYLLCSMILLLTSCNKAQDTCSLPTPGNVVNKNSCDTIEFNLLLPSGVATAPSLLSYNDAQTQFECFAWQTFTALNWPAVENCRGVADINSSPINSSKKTVWQGYKKTYELFQPFNSDWDASAVKWHDDEPIGTCSDAAETDLGLVYENKFAFTGGSSVIADQNSNKTYSQVLMNPDTFFYLINNKLAESGTYDAGGPRDLTTYSNINFPTQTQGITGHGSIELKATWKVMTDADDKNHYITRTAMINIISTGSPFDEDVDCTKETLGLVGFHMIRKINHGQKWIWSTWEHEDNVPDAGSDGDSNTNYSFFSQQCATDQPDYCWSVLDLGGDTSDSQYLCCNNLLLENDYLGDPNQLTRINSIQANSNLTEAYQAAFSEISSPLSHYILVGTQWATKQGNTDNSWDKPCNPTGAWRVPTPTNNECYEQQPATLRSAVTEGYNIAYNLDGEQILTDGCMNCHQALGVDGSFLWSNAVINGYEIE